MQKSVPKAWIIRKIKILKHIFWKAFILQTSRDKNYHRPKPISEQSQ